MAKSYIPYDGPIVTYQFAKKNGLKRYFNNVQCRYGHISERMTGNSGCYRCHYERGLDKAASQETLAYQSQYKKDRRELYNANLRKWKKLNKEKVNVQTRNYKSKKRKAEGEHGIRDIRKLVFLQKEKCANCQTKISDHYHVDHIQPLAKGGTNWPGNLQLLCPTCNMRKHAKNPIDWARENGRLL